MADFNADSSPYDMKIKIGLKVPQSALMNVSTIFQPVALQ